MQYKAENTMKTQDDLPQVLALCLFSGPSDRPSQLIRLERIFERAKQAGIGVAFNSVHHGTDFAVEWVVVVVSSNLCGRWDYLSEAAPCKRPRPTLKLTFARNTRSTDVQDGIVVRVNELESVPVGEDFDFGVICSIYRATTDRTSANI